LKEEFIWHGEIEARLDACNPLLCVAIYDSCRDNPPEVIADIVKNSRLVIIKNISKNNYVNEAV
jgi:hypothetical protein